MASDRSSEPSAGEGLGYRLLLGQKRIFHRMGGGRTARETPIVVFVTGAPRSGTNLIMDILARSLYTDVYNENDPRVFDAHELKPDSVLRSAISKSRATTIVFKSVCEAQDLASLVNRFGPAYGLWSYRDYRPVVRAHVREWSGMSETIRILASDPDATHGWRGRGMSAKTRDLVQRCYHDDLSNESACALFWYIRNVLFFEQRLQSNQNVALVSYDELVAKPEVQARIFFEMIGLEFKPRVCGFVSPGAATSAGDDNLDIDAPIRKVCDELLARLDAVPRRQLEPPFS